MPALRASFFPLDRSADVFSWDPVEGNHRQPVAILAAEKPCISASAVKNSHFRVRSANAGGIHEKSASRRHGAVLVALAINAWWVDSQTRAAAPRDGGVIIDTPIVPANVKVEGQGPAVLLIHGFGAAIDWWDKIAPGLAANHRVIRVDLIGHGGTAAPLNRLFNRTAGRACLGGSR